MNYYKNKNTSEVAFFGGTPEDNWELASDAEIDNFDLSIAINQKLSECQRYLESTDWQAAAFIKYGRPIDDNVKENCIKARELRKQISACKTLKELKKININFE